jgi:hypothetical protein
MANALPLRRYSIGALSHIPVGQDANVKAGLADSCLATRPSSADAFAGSIQTIRSNDIIALQCYTIAAAILPTLRGIYGDTYKSEA